MYSSNDGHSEPTAVKGGDAEYKSVMDRYKKAKGRWNNWQDVWEEIYDYVLPHRESFFQEYSGQRRTENIYDETAVVGLPKFASRLQLGFFPPNEPSNSPLAQSFKRGYYKGSSRVRASHR